MTRVLNGCMLTRARGQILAYVREHEDSEHADIPRGVSASQIASHVDVQISAVRENCVHLEEHNLLKSQQGIGPNGPRQVWVTPDEDDTQDAEDKPRKREYIP